MRITLRKRVTGKEKTALYLDILQHGKRIRESLNLFLFNEPKNKHEQIENKQTLELAERLRSERLIEMQDDRYGTNRQDNRKDNFLKYFETKTDEKREEQQSLGNYGQWLCTLLHLKKCYGDVLTIDQLTVSRCLQFQTYLKDKARTKSNQPLAQNSKYSYLNKFKACLKLAYKERLINENLSDFVPGFKQGEPNREYLTFEEVQKLAETECPYAILKSAFLFSCLTGIRWSDIQRLSWANLRFVEKRGFEVCFRQQKTKGMEYLPISEQAVNLLGERGVQDERIFKGLKYSSYIHQGIIRWMHLVA